MPAQPIAKTHIFGFKKEHLKINIKYAKRRDKYDKKLTNALI
jgi:hypothetical protein